MGAFTRREQPPRLLAHRRGCSPRARSREGDTGDAQSLRSVPRCKASVGDVITPCTAGATPPTEISVSPGTCVLLGPADVCEVAETGRREEPASSKPCPSQGTSPLVQSLYLCCLRGEGVSAVWDKRCRLHNKFFFLFYPLTRASPLMGGDRLHQLGVALKPPSEAGDLLDARRELGSVAAAPGRRGALGKACRRAANCSAGCRKSPPSRQPAPTESQGTRGDFGVTPALLRLEREGWDPGG